MKSPSIIVLTGPSGAGKSTVAKALLERHPAGLIRFITTTTRPTRPGEKNGEAYHFTSRKYFEKGVKAERFFEWASAYNELYGSDKQELERLRKQEKPILIVLNTEGAQTIKSLVPETNIIFIDAPEAELEKRLRARAGRDNELELRIQTMTEERAFRDQADFVVINHADELEQTIQQVEAIIKTLE
ncbi:hypothetical protein COX00_00400 [Candidatus Uhrbacteria bacterium CG22_combo_CG10-13_8_21_14_all_47_17]|uniref:Guanylate kinase n=1 Tax=Candidatus Uhrbacteria bacterium CG22_combo_CG10-13_8_21_14_all_47_17 TaxID=1975041 RepID=A0A2H0BV61_9BACT|nr:MAG: hypothetical protein COX00_00400 [Candidatus Uhrbacteria bacterium CG22_combo_CG10-13_8_21_14_all_47_17]